MKHLNANLTEEVLAQEQAANGLSLYLHIPFCKTRCTYCDFNTYTNLGHLQGRYALALAQEIERSLAAANAGIYHPLKALPTLDEIKQVSAASQIRTVFFGGGTPSLLPASFLGKSLEAMSRQAGFVPNAEITVEANPGTLSLEKLRGLRSIGVNRLSFGVQTFDDNLLKTLGRTHNSAGAIEALEMSRRAGFDNVNLDFIYGLPTQTLASWVATLERAVSIQPAHLSIYALTVEEGTMLHRQVESGKVTTPDNDAMADMYEAAQEILTRAGYIQYEISNWALAKPGDHPDRMPALACRHNLAYWRNEPYLGCGPGAHSSFGGWRFAVLKDPTEYIRRLRQNESVIEIDEAERTTHQLKLADTVILGLRLNEGLDLQLLEQEFGQNLESLYPGKLAKFKAAGLIEEFSNDQNATRLRLTPKGRLLSNEVFIEFLPD